MYSSIIKVVQEFDIKKGCPKNNDKWFIPKKNWPNSSTINPIPGGQCHIWHCMFQLPGAQQVIK